MADSSDPQRSKRAAAAAYDYDGDPRWAEYWSNVLVPPGMASRADVVDHYKRKFYQRYIDPDLLVESMSSASSSQSSGPSTGAGSSFSSQRSASRTGTATATASRGAPSGTTSNRLQLNRQTIQFSVNAWILIVALVGIFPLCPRNLGYKAYRLSLLGTACSSLYSLYILYGKPRAWNLPSVQGWFQTIIGTKDFICFVYCIVFVSFQAHFKLAIFPLMCRALEHNAKFLHRHFSRSQLYRRYLEKSCLWVEANTTTLALHTSHAEVALGFLLAFSLLSWHRSVLQTFMYWNLLKLMYHAPPTAGCHKGIWTKIGQISYPYIHRYAPLLNTPLLAIQRWWFN